ncbi:MAG: AAC(3) family N-acetyltransferase [Oligoflexia bacterium]|nr:AAC(3) family N-acetyltransferase [Oligoflexia bacterium]
MSKLTRNNPGFLHFDITGFIRISRNPLTLLHDLNNLIKECHFNGGNIFIPLYSYSYTDNEEYSLKKSVSKLGKVSDYFRILHPEKRTIDAIFSYAAFSNWVNRKYFQISNYATFSKGSLIDDIFNKDGLLMSVGRRLHYSTEVHYIERLLEVKYRFDKNFHGTFIDLDNNKHSQVVTYFCRDLEFAKKMNITVSFEKLFNDLQDLGIVQNYYINGDFHLEVVNLQQVYDYLKIKLPNDPFYLMKKIKE